MINLFEKTKYQYLFFCRLHVNYEKCKKFEIFLQLKNYFKEIITKNKLNLK